MGGLLSSAGGPKAGKTWLLPYPVNNIDTRNKLKLVLSSPRLHGFRPNLRLRNSVEFSRLRQVGRKFHTRHFVVYDLARPDGPCRLGLTVSRKVGGAVQRNALKRYLREWFRLTIQELPSHTDISLVAKSSARDLGFADVRDELKCLCRPVSSLGSQP